MSVKAHALVSSMVLALVLGGCGAEDSTTIRTTYQRALARPYGSDPPNRTENKMRGAEPECTYAHVALGKVNGSVDFTVRCFGSPSGAEVQFMMGRNSLRGKSRGPGIVSFRRYPVIKGSNVDGSSYGTCGQTKDGMRCRAIAKGMIDVKGRIWVVPRWRCAMGISILVIRPSRCSSRFCPANLPIRYLTEGLPRGC